MERKKMSKISIIGAAGNVGSTVAYALVLHQVCDEIVLIDIMADAVKAQEMDIRHGLPAMGECYVHAGEYSDIKDSDMIIITSGRGRKPGETRLDLAAGNAKITKSVIDEVKKYYNTGVIMVISNPCDVLTQKVTDWMGLPAGKVFGSGTALDTSRFIVALADYLGVDVKLVTANLVGEHGDGMFPAWSCITINGQPLAAYCEEKGIKMDDEVKAELEEKVRTMGGKIIAGKRMTNYGVATTSCYIAKAVIHNSPIVAAVSSTLQGEYGVEGVALSVRSIVAGQGVKEIIPEKLTDAEIERFQKGAENIKNTIASLDV